MVLKQGCQKQYGGHSDGLNFHILREMSHKVITCSMTLLIEKDVRKNGKHS